MKKPATNLAAAWASLRSEMTVPPTALEVISDHHSLTAARGQRVYRHGIHKLKRRAATPPKPQTLK